MPVVLDYAAPPLRRQIGLFGATMLGLGSILGTGVFVGLAQATALAGPWVLLAIVLAGGLAFCNAMSSAQLAAAHPVSGGTYEYGYRLLSPAWGFTAGWTFLLAKSASAATAALAIAKTLSIDDELRKAGIYIGAQSYLTARLVDFATATVIVIVIATASLIRLRRSTRMNNVIVGVTLAGLIALVVGTLFRDLTGLTFSMRTWIGHAREVERSPYAVDVLHAAALAFVAFAGYARVATLGEEVESSASTVPRAMIVSLMFAVVLYVMLAQFVLRPYTGIFQHHLWSERSLSNAARQLEVPGIRTLLTLSALTAMLGVLLNLILGLSRVWLAMGRRGDMPRLLSRVSERTGTPVPATILSGLVIAAFVLVGDVRLTWSFSAFSVLIYYAITNWACLRLPVADRRHPRALAWVGLVSCLSLAWFVEMKVWAVGVGLIAVGLAWHRLRRGARSLVA